MLPASEREIGNACELWERGEDPDGTLDPGRLLELEASLRKDQGKPALALTLLEKAEGLSRKPATVMLKKGLNLARLGEHEAAIQMFGGASLLIPKEGEARLWNVQRFSLAASYCHVRRHEEAAAMIGEVRELASQLGDKLDLIKIGWLEGRIASGLGSRATALRALERAAEQFSERRMLHNVALVREEQAVLQQGIGRM
jgi:tetratricopeptide (TPR) repeat protein